MIYLASFRSGSLPFMVDDFEILDDICEELSLIPINKYIRNSKYTINLPLINNLFSLRESGISLIYVFNNDKVYYAVDGNHIKYKDRVRDKLIDRILR
jgi:hypothetical protein